MHPRTHSIFLTLPPDPSPPPPPSLPLQGRTLSASAPAPAPSPSKGPAAAPGTAPAAAPGAAVSGAPGPAAAPTAALFPGVVPSVSALNITADLFENKVIPPASKQLDIFAGAWQSRQSRTSAACRSACST
jgi:hypothetical protein